MHMLTGKWKITAHTPLGEMDLVADFAASEDAATFTGSVFDEKNNKTTYVTLKGLEMASKEQKELSAHAIALLQSLHMENDFLMELIKSLITRIK